MKEDTTVAEKQSGPQNSKTTSDTRVKEQVRAVFYDKVKVTHTQGRVEEFETYPLGSHIDPSGNLLLALRDGKSTMIPAGFYERVEIIPYVDEETTRQTTMATITVETETIPSRARKASSEDDLSRRAMANPIGEYTYRKTVGCTLPCPAKKECLDNPDSK